MTHTTTTANLTGSMRRIWLTLAVAAAALLALPATSLADKFGSDLKNNDGSVVQPSNSTPAHKCDPDPTESCTRVAIAFGDTGAADDNVKAPHDGTIHKIKLVAGSPGSFRLQLAKVKDLNQGMGFGEAKVVDNGPKISYVSSANGPDYAIQKFDVNIHVEKGEYLAAKQKETSMLRCATGSTEQLLFQPPLQPGGPFELNDDDDDCTMLIQAQMS